LAKLTHQVIRQGAYRRPGKLSNGAELNVAGYLIANLDVTDATKFEEYREKVRPLIEKFGGRYLVRGGELRRLEGNLPLHRLVVLEFPTLEAAQRFYDSAEYRPILKLRLDSARSDLVLAEGYSR
jgi:uncharacterized protein (DUF1330 family)